MTIRNFIRSGISRVVLGLALSTIVAYGAPRDLVRDSPFLPEGWEPPRPREPVRPTQPPRAEPPRGPQPLDRLEFRGMTRFQGRTEFSLFDPTENRSFWIAAGQTEGGFSVIEFNERDAAVVVSHDGRQRAVAMKESMIQPLQETPPPRTREIVGAQPAEQAEDREERMRNLAEEIRRRREVRRALIEEAEARGGDQQQQGNVTDGPPPLPQ